MLSILRNNFFSKFFWLFMGLYMLNISVDTADPNPQHIPEDLTFNDQESIIEVILEQILGYENAIQEYDDNDTEDHNTKKPNLKIDLINHLSKVDHLAIGFLKRSGNNFIDRNNAILKGFYDLDIPPPKI
ncbi:hypothetical protein SAMN05192540_0356 [Maribacter dokdonensis]|uniref:Uncharacterized protein n=2 Tax=Maribacter dokdonensis TaxID=320912 RepID=A0A1H4JGC2_9FLAO|nr:hypothetical protein SAMN05192540_0356 [Maribacter dokdonensis]